MSHPRWAERPPDPQTYRAPTGRPRGEAVAEQDGAAGGRDKRRLPIARGRMATASVELKFLGGRRVYAYLRYQDGGKTINRYIGEAPGENREERLRIAWRKAREIGPP